jgi:hypothetical protein
MTLSVFRPEIAEIRIADPDDFVETLDGLVDLRRDHTNQPIIVRSRKFPNDQGGAEFPLSQAGRGKAKKDDLSFPNHAKTSFRSFSE